MDRPIRQPQWEVTALSSLDAQTLAQELAAEVLRADGVALKLEWEFAETRVPGQTNNFCCRTEGLLIGYALLEGDGSELEVTAAVLPSFRRRGVFTSLLQAVTQEARRRKATRLLLVGYRKSASGTAAVQALGLKYESSEYRIEANAETLPLLNAGEVELAEVNSDETKELTRMLGLTFGREPFAEVVETRLRDPSSRYFFVELREQRVGQIGSVGTEEGLYIRGVGILPEHRRRGYGRQTLSALLLQAQAEGHTRFLLDVATENPSALSIYQSCGFQAATVYDYSLVPLMISA